MAEETETRNVVTIDGQDFEIGPPDAVSILRIARIVARVGLEADKSVRERIGVMITNAMSEEGEGDGPSEADVLPIVFSLLTVVEDDDLYKLGAAFLQFQNEVQGVRWLQEHGLPLNALVQAVMLNLSQTDDIVGAIRSFVGGVQGQVGMMQAQKMSRADLDAKRKAAKSG
jgi:hypothetical protein